MLFDYPDKALWLAVLATALLAICALSRLLLCLDSLAAKWEFGIFAALALAYPTWFGLCCLRLRFG
jgi:hypothetical protein